jgi:four helix bundle protein
MEIRNKRIKNLELGMMNNKIRNFTDLETWQRGHQAVLAIYTLTKNFPKEEMFGLVSQLRRAAVSITSNIAEGFSRSSYKEKVQFYRIALGSITETQNQLIIARDIGYISLEEFEKISEYLILVHKLCNGLIKKSKLLYS